MHALRAWENALPFALPFASKNEGKNSIQQKLMIFWPKDREVSLILCDLALQNLHKNVNSSGRVAKGGGAGGGDNQMPASGVTAPPGE